MNAVARQILAKGQAQTNAEERKSATDTLSRQVVEFVVQNFVEAPGGRRLASSRVASAMAKFQIDTTGDVLAQSRHFVQWATAKGELILKRKELVHRFGPVPARVTQAVESYISHTGLSLLQKKREGAVVSFDVGCLPGEIDVVAKRLDSIAADFSEIDRKSRRGKGKAKRNGQRGDAAAGPSQVASENVSKTGRSKGRREKGWRSKRSL